MVTPMKIRILRTTIAGLSMATVARPAPNSEWDLGTAFEDAGARETALGGTGMTVARGAAAVGANPAALAGHEGVEVQILGMLDANDERRSYPVHDSFSGYLTDNIYALNSHRYGYPGVTAAWAVHPKLPVLGLAYRPARVADYTYREQILSPWQFVSFFPDDVREMLPAQNIVGDYTDLPLASNSFVQSGGIDRAVFSLGHELFANDRWALAVGAGVDYLMAEISNELAVTYEPVTIVDQITGEIVWDEPLLPYPDWSVENQIEATATAFTGGLRLAFEQRFELAYAFRSGVALDFDDSRTTTVGDSVATEQVTLESKIPPRHSVGLLFHPVNEVRTVLAFQVDYEPWASDGDVLSSRDPEDLTRYRLGVEHLLPGGTPFRFGFTYGAPYSGAERNRVGFSAGTQLSAGPATIDVAGALGYAAYRDDDPINDLFFAAEPRTERERVEERLFRVTAALTFGF